nr:DUF3231 family protein [Neobacillus sp. Marseille-Q6967]
METKHPIPLTSSEISALWGCYMGDSMSSCVLRYFLNTEEDEDIKALVKYALGLTEEHLAFISKLFQNEKFPIPHGFTDDDVDVSAPKLFSDIFILFYLKQMGSSGMGAYSLALGSSSRIDIREFFNHNLKTTAELYNKATTLSASKGLLIRPPYIQYPETAEFVQKEGWVNGLFGDRRPLNVSEITHLHLNTITNTLGKTMMIGFSQVSKSKEVKKLFIRGRDISIKHVEVLSSLLRDDYVPAPEIWDTAVTNSTTAPFSDKLMLFHTVSLAQLGIGNYGMAMSASSRRDLAANYMRLNAEAGTFADDCAELLIQNEWFEKMPGVVERDTLGKG